jgi:prepilin-type N-terminal cleavage/methylation domain-containing protein
MKRGFTLIEVLIASTVTALLVVGVLAGMHGSARSAETWRGDSRREERRELTVELLRRDWRSRTRIVVTEGASPAGTTMIAFASVSDSLAGAKRAQVPVRYSASSHGLVRHEGGRDAHLLNEPVILEAWNGEAWGAEARGDITALRLTLSGPSESVIIR